MARDKLITVRIEEDLRDRFNQWTKDNNTDASTVLYDFIKRCLDGTIDANLATGKTVVGLDNRRLDKIESAIQGIYTRLDSERQRLDERLDGTGDRLNALEDAIGIMTDRFDRVDRSITETRSTMTGVSCLLPPATTAREVDRLSALENRTEEMMKTLLQLQEDASIARPEKTYPAMKTSPGEGFDESPASIDTPGFKSDVSIDGDTSNISPAPEPSHLPTLTGGEEIEEKKPGLKPETLDRIAAMESIESGREFPSLVDLARAIGYPDKLARTALSDCLHPVRGKSSNRAAIASAIDRLFEPIEMAGGKGGKAYRRK